MGRGGGLVGRGGGLLCRGRGSAVDVVGPVVAYCERIGLRPPLFLSLLSGSLKFGKGNMFLPIINKTISETADVKCLV